MELQNQTDVQEEFRSPDQVGGLESPFTEQTFLILESTFHVFGRGSLAIFGLVANVINVVVFYHQGIMASSSSVSLTALAINDFFCCLLAAWGSICGLFYHYVDTSTWKWEVIGFMIFTATRPLNMTTQITCWITAFATFERAFSVIFPFKVKFFFSPKRSLIAMVCIFVGNFMIYFPNNIDEFAVWETNPTNNVTYIGWQPSNITPFMVSLILFNYINNIGIRTGLIVFVVLCNLAIFWKVQLSQKFRQSKANASSSKTKQSVESNYQGKVSDIQTKQDDSEVNPGTSKTQGTQDSTKEMKLLRMIVVIAVVFVVCYTGQLVHTIAYVLLSEFNVDHHWHENYVAFSVAAFLEILNSSVNVIIYYVMSTRFREQLQSLCCLWESKK